MKIQKLKNPDQVSCDDCEARPKELTEILTVYGEGNNGTLMLCGNCKKKLLKLLQDDR